MPAEETHVDWQGQIQELQRHWEVVVAAAIGAEEVAWLVGGVPKQEMEEVMQEYHQEVSLALPQDQTPLPWLLLLVVLGEAVSCSPNAVGICFSTN